MTRFYYILSVLLLLLSCSENVLLRDGNKMANDKFRPLLFVEKIDTVGNSKEYSYSFFRQSGDSAIWEEVVIRLP